MSEAARERDRRMGERRQPRRSPTADGVFGAFGSAEDTQVSRQRAVRPRRRRRRTMPPPRRPRAPTRGFAPGRAHRRRRPDRVRPHQYPHLHRRARRARRGLVLRRPSPACSARVSLEAALISVAWHAGAGAGCCRRDAGGALARRRALAEHHRCRPAGLQCAARWRQPAFNYVALLVLPVLMAGVLARVPLRAGAPRRRGADAAGGGGGSAAWRAQPHAAAGAGGAGRQRPSSSPCWLASSRCRLAREELCARGNMEMAAPAGRR